MQTQCWICPHCHDDAYHKSDENCCEWQEYATELDAEFKKNKTKTDENKQLIKE